jgi:hypothetical protein
MPVSEACYEITSLHRLTHRKLALAEERERRIAERFVERFGEPAEAVLQAVYQKHPAFLGSARLEELIEDDDPTAYLEEAARAQALREAAVLTALQERLGDEAEVEIRLGSYDHGWETGDRLARLLDMGDCEPAAAADLLADHFPGGTAWGPGPRITEEDESHARWSYLDGSTLELWNEAEASVQLLCSSVAFWCKGFGEALNPMLDFRQGASLADGDPHNEGVYTLDQDSARPKKEPEPA